MFSSSNLSISDMSEKEKSTAKRTYTRLEFDSEQEEKLIEYVKEHPVLYNPKDGKYKNKSYRDRLWDKFGTTINKSGLVFYCLLLVNMILENYSFVISQERSAAKNGLISKTCS